MQNLICQSETMKTKFKTPWSPISKKAQFYGKISNKIRFNPEETRKQWILKIEMALITKLYSKNWVLFLNKDGICSLGEEFF